ncbi:MAG: aminotransferase class V-fold PLP-dependent enzyme [Longimicrobiales bacterium]
MDLSRRAFLGTVPAAAAVARWPGAPTLSDPLGVRDDFPVASRVTYLNSAYITPSPAPVIAAARGFLESKSTGPVSLGDMLGEVDRVRQGFADLIHVSQEEVGVLFSTSDGENIVTQALDLQPGDNVVVDDLHYETTYLLYQELAKERGIELRIVRNSGGAVPPEAFEALVDDRTRLVSVAWVSHQNGFRHDLAALAEIAHAKGAFLYTDAIQGMGAVELDAAATGVDFLAAGTYKWLLGGYGVAPFYVRRELLDLVRPDRFGSLNIEETLAEHTYKVYDDGRKYGYATMAFGAVYQLGAALDYLAEVTVPRIEAHALPLAQHLRAELSALGFDVLTPEGNRSPIVAFAHGRSPQRMEDILAQSQVQVSLREEGTQIRAGVALFNTADDVDLFLEVMAGA